ncbi:unnamed protein product [Microthlaspi erraticum]|uniref:Uncharacterized protein n=1 Tax=Microthlaspi erraticum TaxID=1685480 RepID=A0A6D2JQQ9_9BRAS|nr:unnamed protein product [Microthlaspi erraticum]
MDMHCKIPRTISEKTTPPASLSNVIKIKDRKRVKVLWSGDKVDSVSNLSSIVSVAEANPTSSTEEKVVVSKKSELVDENYRASLRETNSYQKLTENRAEVRARPISSN